MEVNVKKTSQDVLKWTVVGGSAVIAVGAVMQLTKATSLKSAVMPIVTLLVGVSAFSYAMSKQEVGFIPKLDGSSDSELAKNSEDKENSNINGLESLNTSSARKVGVGSAGRIGKNVGINRAYNQVSPIPLGRLKKGDQAIFGVGKDKECCTWMGDYWRCTPAPCNITL